jgi:hypothetical protein
MPGTDDADTIYLYRKPCREAKPRTFSRASSMPEIFRHSLSIERFHNSVSLALAQVLEHLFKFRAFPRVYRHMEKPP